MRAVLHGVGHSLDALPAVVVAHRDVVVQVDVLVHGAALSVEVEHAAGARGRSPVLDASCFRRHGRRLLRGHDVVALMRTAGARRSEVVYVLHGPDDRKDDPRHRRRARRAGKDPDCGREYEDASGCRPVADHRSGSRPKGRRLAGRSALESAAA